MDNTLSFRQRGYCVWCFIAFTFIFLLTACSDNSGSVESIEVGGESRGNEQLCDAIKSAALVRSIDAGGGRQVQLQLLDESRNILNPTHSDCLTLLNSDSAQIPITTSSLATGNGATLIIVQTGNTENRQRLESLIRLRPADEKISIWSWSDSLNQIVAPTVDRERMHQRIETVWDAPPRQPLSVDLVEEQAQKIWSNAMKDSLTGIRSIVFIASELVAQPPTSDDDNLRFYWSFSGDTASGRSVNEIAEIISTQMNIHESSKSLLLGFCDSGEKNNYSLQSNQKTILEFTLEKLASEQKDTACNLSATIQTMPPQYPTINIALTPEEVLIYEQRLDNLDKTEFNGKIQLSNEQGLTKIKAKLHGSSSLACTRKSLSINLAGNQSRTIAGSFEFAPFNGDEFHLISMCLDKNYIHQINGDRLMQKTLAWELPATLVELQINQQSRGLYFLIGKPKDVFKRNITGLSSIIRRRTDILGHQPDVTWSAISDDEALQHYNDFVDEVLNYSGSDLLTKLQESMDTHQYLRWIALMSLLENGDYIDEVFFIGTDSIDSQGSEKTFFHINGWDSDDLFSACHHEGRDAINDPNKLIYCTESKLDHKIFSDNEVYATYVDILSAMIDEITPEVFNQTTTSTRDGILDILRKNNSYLAMTEMLTENPATADFEVFESQVAAATKAMQQQFYQRRELLKQRIGHWRRQTKGIKLELIHPTNLPENTPLPIVIKAVDPSGELDSSSSGKFKLTVNQADSIQQHDVVLRRGIGSITIPSGADSATLEVINESHEPSAFNFQNQPAMVLSGVLDDDQLHWSDNSLILITEDIIIPKGKILTIDPGVTVLTNAEKNIYISGSVFAKGTKDNPILFSATDKDQPWGGLILNAAEGSFKHVFFTAGGGDLTRVFGHSDSQPMLFAENSIVDIGNSVFQDAPGKALGAVGGEWTITHTLITRTDTGAEFHDATVKLTDSQFYDFPTLNPQEQDDDNDAIYLKADPNNPEASDYQLNRVTLIEGADDGIDHSGSLAKISESWIEGFDNECIAASAGGEIVVEDTVLNFCEQGLEAGWGSPSVVGKNLLVMQCDTGLRFGDGYSKTYDGAMRVTDSIIINNKGHAIRNWSNSSHSSITGAIWVDHSIIDQDEVATGEANLILSPVLDQNLLLSRRSAGHSTATDQSNPGLKTAREK